MNINEFIEALKVQGIELSSRQLAQFETYYQMLYTWNEKMNLTNILEHDEVYLKHFYDSLTLAFYHPLSDQSMLDIGAGAGFPSIPLKIVYPSLKVTIVDSLNKRITFLQALFEALGLENVAAVNARAEEYCAAHRAAYDIVTARAVARFEILDELCLPLVKEGGYFIALKGAGGKEEYIQAAGGIEKLGGKLEAVHEFQLPGREDQRMNYYIKKIKSTPAKYPRAFAKIKKSPLK